MNEDFVTIEIAKKLHENGFNEPCINAINPYGCTYLNGWCEYLDNRDGEHITQKDLKEGCYLLPTIPQVLKWLREEKKIVISIFPHPCGWQADIYKDVHEYYDSEAECYLMHYYKEKTEISHSYNWLEIYCIQYVLDNLI